MILSNLVEGILALDDLINSSIPTIWDPTLTLIMTAITHIASLPIMAVLSITLFIILYKKRKFGHLLLLSFSMAGGLIIKIVTKIFIHRARPENALIHASGYSFFSGHAELSLIFFIVVIISFRNEIKDKFLKYALIISCVLMFSLIGFSRLYLSVHWFSDIIVGYIVGILWMVIVIHFLNKASIKLRAKIENYLE